MKILLAAIPLALAGCFAHRELQGEMVRAELIRIDTVNRYSADQKKQQKILTWRDSDDVEFITYVPMNINYLVGTNMTMIKMR